MHITEITDYRSLSLRLFGVGVGRWSGEHFCNARA